MLEKIIEETGTRYAVNKGWLVYKVSSPGNTGVLDRIHHRNGVTFYIEYKATGKKASPKQQNVARELMDKDIPCYCCDSIAKAWIIIDAMTTFARSLAFNYTAKGLGDLDSFY